MDGVRLPQGDRATLNFIVIKNIAKDPSCLKLEVKWMTPCEITRFQTCCSIFLIRAYVS